MSCDCVQCLLFVESCRRSLSVLRSSWHYREMFTCASGTIACLMFCAPPFVLRLSRTPPVFCCTEESVNVCLMTSTFLRVMLILMNELFVFVFISLTTSVCLFGIVGA